MFLLDKLIKPVQHGLVGLDVGHGAVKLIGLTHTASGWSASCAAWSDIAPVQDATLDQDVTPGQDAPTLQAVRRCLKSVPGHLAQYAVCGLSGSNASVRGFSFPAMPDNAIEQAVRFEAQQVCPMDMHRSVLDYQLMRAVEDDGAASAKQSGVLVAGTDQAIQERCKLIKDAGGRVTLMDADGLATLNCLAAMEDLDRYETVAIVDIGHHYTNVILLGPNGLPFVRDIDSGCAALIQKTGDIAAQEADVIDAALWGNHKQSVPGTILAALHQAARPLMMSINETLKFYTTQEKVSMAERLYLCGGGALIAPLAELLCDALPTTVTVFDPFTKIQVDEQLNGADVLLSRGPAFAVAVGLAMRTA